MVLRMKYDTFGAALTLNFYLSYYLILFSFFVNAFTWEEANQRFIVLWINDKKGSFFHSFIIMLIKIKTQVGTNYGNI